MTYTTYLIVWILLIAANLYMAKVNTDTFYKFIARKRYAEANIARILVVINLGMGALISVGIFFI